MAQTPADSPGKPNLLLDEDASSSVAGAADQRLRMILYGTLFALAIILAGLLIRDARGRAGAPPMPGADTPGIYYTQ